MIRRELIRVKSASQIEAMRASGELLARCMDLVLKSAKPGVKTIELDRAAEEFIRGEGAVPSFKNFPGGSGTPPFSGNICTSVNREVVHGVPGDYVLADGDVLSVDMGAILEGWHSDMARTIQVGTQTPEAQKLIRVTRDAFFAGMDMAREGSRLRDISSAIEKVLLTNGYGIVRDLVGHGIGREMHEPPEIPNFTFRGANPRLRAGMVLAIEPMVTLGPSGDVEWSDPDAWPVTTADGTIAAHYENTVAVTENGPEILTRAGEVT